MCACVCVCVNAFWCKSVYCYNVQRNGYFGNLNGSAVWNTRETGYIVPKQYLALYPLAIQQFYSGPLSTFSPNQASHTIFDNPISLKWREETHVNFLISCLALTTLIPIPWPMASRWQADAVVQGRRKEN